MSDQIPALSIRAEDDPDVFVRYQKQVLDWVEAAVTEGDALLQAEPTYQDIDRSIAYIMGDQIDPKRPKDLAGFVDNRTKNIILKSVAALTDIHPLFGFKTFNPRFNSQGDVLDKLARAWWVNSFSDLRLADVIRYAAVGCGYCEVHWDPSAGNGMGDISLVARDPRDVIPIRPSFGLSLQSWEGVCIRTAETVNALRGRYPEAAGRIVADSVPSTFFERTWASARKAWANVVTAMNPTDRLINRPRNAPNKIPTCEIRTTYVKDRRLHTGDAPIVVGDPRTSWSYKVFPVGSKDEQGRPMDPERFKLYPRGRLIISTKTTILYDGPNPYWHGLFPIAKLSLDPWPWALLGCGIARDLMPMQDLINELVNGIVDHVRKVLRPGVVADKRAVPDSLWARLDTRIPGLKIKQNPTAGKGVEVVKNEALPSEVFQLLQMAIGEADYLSGVANLEALTQLQQAPGADSIERMMEALTPLLRLKGRLLEAFLREVGEMVKTNFFQFYTLPRRVAMLGEAGIDWADFDFDPGTLVPAMATSDPGYTPELDASLPAAERAKVHHRNFTFQITPNSLLAISQISRKLMYLQLWRGGLMDPWTLFEVLEIPNGGEPPGGEQTITDRLIAAMALGLTGQVSPAGRKSSGQEEPRLQMKPDQAGLPRVTVSESG